MAELVASRQRDTLAGLSRLPAAGAGGPAAEPFSMFAGRVRAALEEVSYR